MKILVLVFLAVSSLTVSAKEIVDIGVGPENVCALYSDEVRCFGQKIDGATVNLKGFKNARHLEMGVVTCLQDDDGTWCYGTESYLPDEVLRAEAVSVVGGRVCIRVGEKLTCWSNGDFKQVYEGVAEDVAFAAADYGVVCLIDKKDGLLCMGNETSRLVKEAPQGRKDLVSLETQISTDHVCAISKDRRLVCWGSNAYNQLDIPSDLGPVDEVSISGAVSCAIASGQVRCWGQPQRRVRQVPHLVNPRKLQLGENDVACVEDDTGLVCWGSMENIGPIPRKSRNVRSLFGSPGLVCALEKASSVNCWGRHTFYSEAPYWLQSIQQIDIGYEGVCAVYGPRKDLYCWPHGKFVVPPEVTQVRSFALAGGRACAIGGRGVSCWDMSRQYEFPIPNMIDPKLIVGGEQHFCAVDAFGVLCWGDNDKGQLDSPKEIFAPSEIASDGDNTCVVEEGKVVCWGSNEGGINDAPEGLANPNGLVVAYSHACILDNGEPVCWGKNDKGQLNVPEGVTGVLQLTAGYEHTCALMPEDRIACWGSNEYGALDIPKDLP